MGSENGGLLTPRQREVLKGTHEEGLSDANIRAHKSRIRERVYGAFQDGTVLLNRITPDDRRKIFERWQDAGEEIDPETQTIHGEDVDPDEVDGEPHGPLDILEPMWDPDAREERDSFERALIGTVTFIYLGAEQAQGLSGRRILESAVEHAEKRQGNNVVADLELSERFDTEMLREQFDNREPLTGAELAHLRREGEIDAEAWGQYSEEAFQHVEGHSRSLDHE